MRKFVVHTRALPGCRKDTNAPTVLEVEGELITAIEDPSVLWLPEGEFRFRIFKPESLYEPKEIVKQDKSIEKIMIPPVYHSHAVYWTATQALSRAERMVRESFEHDFRKKKIAFTEEQVREKCKEIQEILL